MENLNIIYIDGAVQNNPGSGGIGIICKNSTEKVIFKISKNVGKVTNNEAEYLALIEALKEALKNKMKRVIIYSDSELLVNQMNDRYKVRDKNLYKYYIEAKNFIKEFEQAELKYISRKENKEADILAFNASKGGW